MRLASAPGCRLQTSWAGRVRDRLPVAWTLASGDTARDIAEAEEMLSRRRHNVFKLKIGRNEVGADIAHVAAVRRAVGDRASVRVDVNQAWSETIAAKAIAELEALGVDLVEQPIAQTNRRGMTRLAANAVMPSWQTRRCTGPRPRSTMQACRGRRLRRENRAIRRIVCWWSRRPR